MLRLCLFAKIACLVTSLMAPALGFGQRELFFRNYTTKDGLSYNLVNCLHEDREGYIWVGTFNGLNRFDGSRFLVFKSDRNDPNSLPQNNITSICEDTSDNIWLGTSYGVSRYSKTLNRFTNYILPSQPEESSRTNDITNILCDRRGTIWCTSANGLFEYIPSNDSFKAYLHDEEDRSSISSNQIHRNGLAEDKFRNILWIGTHLGTNAFDTERKIFYHYKNNPDSLPIFSNISSYPIYISTNGELIYTDFMVPAVVTYHPISKTIVMDSIDPSNMKIALPLATVFTDANNNRWYSSWGKKAYYVDGSSGKLNPLVRDKSNPYSISAEFFWDAIQARDGTIYIGSMYGLSIHRPEKPFFEIHKPSLQYPQLNEYTTFTSFREDDGNILWLGNDGEGLYSYDFNTGKFEHFNLGKSRVENSILHISLIEGKLWLSTKLGIHIFDPASKRNTSFQDQISLDLSKKTISWTHADKHNNLWFAVPYEGVFKYSFATRKYDLFKLDSMFVRFDRVTFVKAFAEAPDGTLWFGTFSGMLYRYDHASNTFHAYRPDPKQRPAIQQRPINDMYADKYGVWLATEGSGLVKFNPATNKFSSWMQSDGILQDVCNSIIADKMGKLWLGSYEGVSVFDPASEKIVNPALEYGHFQNNYYSRGKTMLKNGRLIYANANNFIVIDPAGINKNQLQPNPVITGLTIFEKYRPVYKTTSSIDLSYKENFFTIDFSSLNHPVAGAIEYAYRLKGYDKDWVEGNKNFASYTGVPGGSYVFEVKARPKNGQWSSVSVLGMHIDPPFWETWWFRVLALLLLASLVYLVIRLRERNLLRQEKLKGEYRERITASEMKALRSQMNPHFLYNSLNAIRLFVLQHDSDNAEKYLVKFARLMRLILENSRQDWVSLSSEIEQLHLYLELEQLRFDNSFDFKIDTDPVLKKEGLSIPPMIIQPYIENAILHGVAHKKDKGVILVSIKPSNNHIECIIDDNGVGRKRSAELKSKRLNHNSVGLKVTEERLELIGERTGMPAGVNVIDKTENDIAMGTKVVVQLPIIHH